MKPSQDSLPNSLVLHLNYLQSGEVLEGQLNSELFTTPEFQPTSPLSYTLSVTLEKNEILFFGQLHLKGISPCARCLTDLPLEIQLNEFTLLLPKQKQETIDLTEALKEDILLALPSYPKCELDPEFRCPITGKNWKAVRQSTEASPPLNNQWSKLDNLK